LLFALLAERHTSATRAQIGRLLCITSQGASHLLRIARSRLKTDELFAARAEASNNEL
jgi:hypothetical protein